MKRGFLTLLAGIGSILGLAGTTVAEPLELGNGVPNVKGKNHKGEEVDLSKAAAKGWAVFFFYPKAATPG